MSWTSAVPDIVVCAALFFVPGLLLSYLGGLRGITAWAMAPVMTVAATAAVAVLGGWFGFRFGVWPVAAGIVVTALLAAALSRVLRARGVQRPPADPRRYSLAVVIGAVVAAVFGAVTFITGVKRPDAINQSWDAILHYNMIRYIEQTGKASPLTIATLGQPGGTGSYGGFYPDAWHLMATLLAQLTGASIPVAAMVTCLAVAVLVWPVSCLLLARHLFGNAGGRAAAAVIITGLLCSLFGPFPWVLTGWGVLWPNALGLAMAPAGVALGMSITRISDGDTFGPVRKWFFGAAGAWAIAISHPNSALSVAVICLVPVLMAIRPYVADQYRRRPLGSTAGLLVIVAVAVVGALGLHRLKSVRYVFSQFWPPFESPGHAVLNAFTSATDSLPAQWLLGAFLVIGMIACFVWRQRRWLVVAELIFAALYVGSAAIGDRAVRLFTGFWYDDSHRLAATLPVVAIPLTTMGVLAVADGLQRAASRTAVAARPAVALAVPLAVGTAIAVGTAARSVPDNAQYFGFTYSTSGNYAFTDASKLQFLDKVAHMVPSSAVVADNPVDGTALLWAFTGTHVLFPQINPTSNNKDMTYLASNLVHLAQDPRACDLVRHYGVGYLVMAPDDYWSAWAHKFYRGVGYPASDSGFRLIAADGQLKLYKITICQPPAGSVVAASWGSG